MNIKINNRVGAGIFAILAFAALILFGSWTSFENLPKSFQKKINKEIPQLWGTEFELKSSTVSTPIKNQLAKFGVEAIFDLVSPSQAIGYVVVAKARSKFENFDYVIYYDQNNVIKAVRVLQYREDYGGEIASKRWLKQFDGKDGDSPIKIDDDIQGISGATISYIAITKGVKNITQIMNEI
jgi:Na+-translocating ferredoxin:NAD+ oxidoreductase RnfG subunit